MPIRPDDAAALARGVRHMFAESETVILAKIARALAQGLDAPDWAEHKLAGIRAVTGDIDRILYDLDKGLPGAVDEAMNLAYNRGRSTAGGELTAAGIRDTVAGSVQTTGAVAALTRDTLGRVEPMLLQIQRASLDIYRHTIAQTTAQVLSGTQTRREASRAALGKLCDAGITGFRDRAGRNWDMASYAEMATRTSSAQAMRQGHVDRITDLGIDLVSISDAPEECSICRPYEGKILSLSGSGVGKKLSDGNRVVASLSEAVSAGLFHVNCRHSQSVYIVGVSTVPKDTEDVEGDKLRQQQRAYERRIRELKRRDAIDHEFGGPGAVDSRSKLRAKQTEFKAWRVDNDRKNLSYRTNLNAR